MNDAYIKLEIEPIVKLQCWCISCNNNLYSYGEMACNLKHVEIDEEAHCRQFDPIKENEVKK